MTRLNQRLLLVLVLVAAASAYWFLALAPQREEAAALQTQIAAEQADLEAARRDVARFEQARAAYPANYATVAQLGKAVPADDDVRSLMVQLDAAAKRSHVEFEVIDVGGTAASAQAQAQAPDAGAVDVIPGATVTADGFTTLPMTFAFRGSYFELSSLFTRLERFVTVSNRDIDVTGRLLILHGISLLPDSPGSGAMRAQINATSYLVPEAPSALPGAPAPASAAPATAPAPSAASAQTTSSNPGAVG